MPRSFISSITHAAIQIFSVGILFSFSIQVFAQNSQGVVDVAPKGSEDSGATFSPAARSEMAKKFKLPPRGGEPEAVESSERAPTAPPPASAPGLWLCLCANTKPPCYSETKFPTMSEAVQAARRLCGQSCDPHCTRVNKTDTTTKVK